MVPIISRKQVLALRQHASHLHQRLPHSRFVDAAFAGLQDSSPRSAIIALHARVRNISASDWESPNLVQIWGPRGAVYVVPRRDVAVFTIGRLPREASRRSEIENAAERIVNVSRHRKAENHASPSTMSQQYLRDLRFASMTGRIRIRWDGSRISWWIVDPPMSDPETARLELARRFLLSLGPSTPAGFAWWSGGFLADANHTFRSLKELNEVKLAGGQAWVLRASLALLENLSSPPLTVRLLPSGDPYLGAADRKLLVPQTRFRSELWPKSVWPGALFANGELGGTWRRQEGRVVIRPWRRVSSEEMEAVEREVQTIPLEFTTKNVRFERPVKPSQRHN